MSLASCHDIFPDISVLLPQLAMVVRIVSVKREPLSLQFSQLLAALAKAAGEGGDSGWQPGAKGTSAAFSRPVRFYPSLTTGKPAGQQTVFGDNRLNLRQFPDLAPFPGRSLPGGYLHQNTAAGGTGSRPVLHDFINFAGGANS